MKKTVLITLAGLVILALAITMVSAGPHPDRMHPSFMGQQANLTEAQKQELAPLVSKMNDLHLQMMEVRKEMIQKQVSFGNMTQEEADQRIARMQEAGKNGFGPGMMGPGHGKGHGPGMMNGCPNLQQQAPATK